MQVRSHYQQKIRPGIASHCIMPTNEQAVFNVYSKINL